MSAFKRVASYGEPVFRGLTGPLWRHACGHITSADLLGDDAGARRPWAHPCTGCGGHGAWLPLFAFLGALCDQCQGNLWVAIGGKVLGAPYGFETVTECTACDASGVAP